MAVRHRAALAVCVALAVCGALIEFAATRDGPDVSPDSVAYLSTADNIAHGRGVTTPAGVELPADPSAAPSSPDASHSEAMTIYAPFYPVVLAPVVRVFGLVRGGRLLGIVLFATLLFLAGWVPYCWTKRSAALWLGPLLILAAPDLLDVYLNIESEVLFLVLLVAAVFWLTRHVVQPSRANLLLAAVAVGLAVLTRYAGAGLIPGGIVVLLWHRGRAWRARAIDAGIFAFISAGPIFLWLVRNAIRGSAADRTVRVHLPTRHDIREALQAIRNWVLPGHASTATTMLAIAILIGVFIWLAWLGREQSAGVPRVLAVLAVCYLGSVLVSKALFDASTGLDERIMTPVHVLYLLGITQLVALRLPERRVVRDLAPAVVFAAVMVFALARGGSWLHDIRPDQFEFASATWQSSPLMRAARQLKEPIVSNADDALYIVDGLPTYAMPQVSNPQSELPNPNVDLQLKELQQFLADRHGVVVYFAAVNWRPYLPTESALERDGLRVLAREPDGVILSS